MTRFPGSLLSRESDTEKVADEYEKERNLSNQGQSLC
jgi:hypothetical protein